MQKVDRFSMLELRNLAQFLLKDFFQGPVPTHRGIDILDFALTYCHLKVRFSSLSFPNSHPWGALTLDPVSLRHSGNPPVQIPGRTILLDSRLKHRSELRNFTIAHECAHYALFHQGLTSLEHQISENYADLLALELLIPPQILKTFFSREHLTLSLFPSQKDPLPSSLFALQKLLGVSSSVLMAALKREQFLQNQSNQKEFYYVN